VSFAPIKKLPTKGSDQIGIKISFKDRHHPGSVILLQKQVSKASIAKIVGVSLPPFTALSRQGGYAHTLKDIFTPIWAGP
jgi:hypothetical protein